MTSKNPNETNIAFFGTSDFSVWVLDELKSNNIIPSLVVSTPDKPKDRKLIITPPPVKIWAKENNIPILQPEKLDDSFILKLSSLHSIPHTLFIVASYGKIIPKVVLDIPKYGSLNVHPSLLPEHRGASPIQSAILKSQETGVTIMLMDEKMDHGPIIVQEILSQQLPIKRPELEKSLAKLGGKLLAEVIPQWVLGNIDPQEQNHDTATFTKKISKEDGLIDLKEDGLINYRKFCAYLGWPGTYFFLKKNGKKIRIIIKDAEFISGKFIIKTVLPEGKTTISWDKFKKSFTS